MEFGIIDAILLIFVILEIIAIALVKKRKRKRKVLKNLLKVI